MNYRRKGAIRPVKERILILCEGGKTEPTYFNSIRTDKLRSNRLSGLRIILHKTQWNTAKELVDEAIKLKKEAIREKNAFNEIWVVFDKDGYTKHPEAFDKARTNNINIAFSSISFEFWLLLHFEYTTAAYSDCDSLIKRLEKHIENYKKNDDHYPLLKPNTQTAIDNTKQIIEHWEKVGNGKIWEHNPYTDVGLLVEKLMSI